MLFQLIDETRGDFPVETFCDVLAVSKSGFYAWKSRHVSARAQEDAQILAEIPQAHRESKGAPGSPRVHAVLRDHGRRIGKARIERLMRETLHAEIVVASWLMAVQPQRRGRGLIRRSDRGSHSA